MSPVLGTTHDAKVPAEEIRFGVILNGGVSLAVWMGGTVHELDRLTKADANGDRGSRIYRTVLALAGCTARADVVAGTSAGGINGAALALGQVNHDARLDVLRDIWVDQGRIESLMRQPFRGSPTSLLRGDEFFLPQVNDALTQLSRPAGWCSPEQAPMDLSITTTVLHGNRTVTVDSMGQRLPQSVHAARFQWRRPLPLTGGVDPFAQDAIERTANRLALASRCTASFPVAFEPVFVPVHSEQHREPSLGALTEVQRLRPDMEGYVESWGDAVPARDRSRFVVDGGLLANTPTRAALEAVERMPPGGPVRRVMLLVYPHAALPDADPADKENSAPTVFGTVTGLLGALTAQGGRTLVDEIEVHNKAAAGRRGTRGDVLRSVDDHRGLDALTTAIYPHYRRLRLWRAARDLAERAVERSTASGSPRTALPPGWNYERVRRAAEEAQRTLGSFSPYVPAQPPHPDTRTASADPGWEWGVTTALGVAEAVADLLRRIVWVLRRGTAYDTVERARENVSRLRAELRDQRTHMDEVWDGDVLDGLVPDQTYWSLRLAWYERLMLGVADPGVVTDLIARVAERESRLGGIDERGADVRAALQAALIGVAAPAPGSAGRAVRSRVGDVVKALEAVLPTLDAFCTSTPAGLLRDQQVSDLTQWRDLLVPGGRAGSRDELLTRFLQLEIAATTLGDEVDTGATLPVELVQLSAQTQNAFTRYTSTSDDKLGGMSINRFGGLLKRSWRVNDWTWGRVDAATTLCRIVLQPARVRRAAQLSGTLDLPGEPSDVASTVAKNTVEDVQKELFDENVRRDPRVVALATRATSELSATLDTGTPVEDLDAAMPALADLFAWALHLEIVPSELPALAGAIRADGVDGANRRSRGEVFLAENEDLLLRLAARTADGAQDLQPPDRQSALEVFDRAGIGREPLREEGSSDQMIRTATTAAAVAATVVDSDRSGLAAVKPVTRAMRGAMLLPYWTVTGLSSRSVLARSLALLGLAVGAVLLALSLFGALPEGLSGPAAAIGAGALLTVFAYGALRTGTMLHGLVLLTPLVPLTAFAVDQSRVAATEATERGVVTLAAVVAFAVALMLLGSIPATTGSVWAALDRLADRQNVPRPWPGRPATAPVRVLRRTGGLVSALVLLLVRVLLPVTVLTALGVWLAAGAWEPVLEWVRDRFSALALVGAVAVVTGAVVAYVLGRQLQVLTVTRRNGDETWTYQPLAHPAGAAAGWAVVYGAGYLTLAALLVFREDWLDAVWARSLLVTAMVMGVVLVLAVPLWLPVRAVQAVVRREVARACVVGGAAPHPSDGDSSRPKESAAHAIALDMVSRGVSYRGLVSGKERPGAEVPRLRPPVGTRLQRRIERALAQQRPEPAELTPRPDAQPEQPTAASLFDAR